MTTWQIIHEDGTTYAKSSEGDLMSKDSTGHWSCSGLVNPPDHVVRELMARHEKRHRDVRPEFVALKRALQGVG